MKTAFAIWNKRIAPVFDTAQLIHVVETDGDRIIGERQESLPETTPLQKALRLLELEVGALVCGAVSKPMRELVSGYGIEIRPFVAGALEEVVEAWFRGNLKGDAFAMPGCSGRERRRRNRLQEPGQEDTMDRGSGMGAGGGRGQGRGGQRMGRMGGSRTGGPSGSCLCPACGHRELHERGFPCVDRKCPKCGAAMARE